MKPVFASAALVVLLAACQPGAEPGDESTGAETGSAAAASNSQPAPVQETMPATVPVPPGEETAVARDPHAIADAACGADRIGPWIGQDSTVPVRRAVVEAASPGSDRWIYPDSVVTHDRIEDRLNVVMERGTNRIVSAHCG